MDSPASSLLQELFGHQHALAAALGATGGLLREAGPDLAEAAESCCRRAEELFDETADVVLACATSAEQVVRPAHPEGGLSSEGGAEGEVLGLAASGQKTQSAYEELAKEVDSIVICLSLTEVEARTPLLEALRSQGAGLAGSRTSSRGGLCARVASRGSQGSTAATEEEDAGSAGASQWESEGSASDCSSPGEAVGGAERRSAALVRAFERAQEAGLAAHGCSSALASLCALLRRQLLMRENARCLLESCARSPALRRRCQQRLDEHAALWEALASSCRRYCGSRSGATEALGVAGP